MLLFFIFWNSIANILFDLTIIFYTKFYSANNSGLKLLYLTLSIPRKFYAIIESIKYILFYC
jgi:hypothetical protein